MPAPAVPPSSVERARWISELDVDALLMASPAYVRPTQQGLFLHFEAIAANSRIPVLLYNVPEPHRGAICCPPRLHGCRDVPRIVGIKEAVGDPARMRELVASCARGLQGAERRRPDRARRHRPRSRPASSPSPRMSRRAPWPTWWPPPCAVIVPAPRRSISASWPCIATCSSNPIPFPVKWAVARMGLIGGTLRLPSDRAVARNSMRWSPSRCSRPASLIHTGVNS